MSYAKGLAMSLDIPIIPISTFDSLVYNFKGASAYVLIYSHGKTFYLSDYSVEDNFLKCNSKQRTILIDEVLKLKRKIIYNGPENYFNEFKLKNLDIELINLKVENLIEIAHSNYQLLKTKSLDNLVPNYVGNFEVK